MKPVAVLDTKVLFKLVACTLSVHFCDETVNLAYRVLCECKYDFITTEAVVGTLYFAKREIRHYKVHTPHAKINAQDRVPGRWLVPEGAAGGSQRPCARSIEGRWGRRLGSLLWDSVIAGS
ncbi:hypothetical protein Pyrfu_1174 [Pyrolobus fumarii 1A]|uniref:Uncharacterized protein n=1 Tax=Pyrolobus fumarii (strain DSM 11204 / 1A) TaxID=694429 RepID=G0EFL3_PYRF1|nr:hypothetical protein [Pyrolobus fumarii]AEM39037.1 hypothetical protein Pyrfu_1174 [Pyrolobus fumarii 1A]